MPVMRKPKGGVPDVADIAGLVGPLGLPAALISKIKPVGLTHEMGKKTLEEVLQKGELGPRFEEALKFAQQRYPRLFAHIPSWKKTEKLFGPLGIQRPLGGSHFSEIELNPGLTWTQGDALETVGHEMAHAAQMLRRGPEKFHKQYLAAQEALGYRRNPLEQLAEQSAKGMRTKHALEPARQAALRRPTPGSMAEFTAVGEEAAKQPGATGPDPVEWAYKMIMEKLFGGK